MALVLTYCTCTFHDVMFNVTWDMYEINNIPSLRCLQRNKSLETKPVWTFHLGGYFSFRKNNKYQHKCDCFPQHQSSLKILRMKLYVFVIVQFIVLSLGTRPIYMYIHLLSRCWCYCCWTWVLHVCFLLIFLNFVMPMNFKIHKLVERLYLWFGLLIFSYHYVCIKRNQWKFVLFVCDCI